MYNYSTVGSLLFLKNENFHCLPKFYYSLVKTKTAIKLTPPTVQILALFSSADKNKIITTLLYFFFFHRPTVFGFWQSADDRPMVGRRLADDRPISQPISYLNETLFIGRCVSRSSADRRPTLSLSAEDRPIVKFCHFLR